MAEEWITKLSDRIGRYDRRQILIWRQMSLVERLAVADQAYHFALEAVRVTERERFPELPEDEFNWRVVRRMQGDQRLGREWHAKPGFTTRT